MPNTHAPPIFIHHVAAHISQRSADWDQPRRIVVEQRDLIRGREGGALGWAVAVDEPCIGKCLLRPTEKRICIVPNYRMIDKTSGAEREAYLPFLIELTKQICRDNHQVFFLIHEGKEDRRIADRINTELDTQLPVIEENDNLRIKGIIGGCDFVIASRFHALVSALSQGVPVLGTGWSHKYQMLFEDYGFPEGLVDVTTDPTIAAGLVDEVLTTKEQDIKIKLKKAAEQEKEKTKKMWMQVIDFISRN